MADGTDTYATSLAERIERNRREQIENDFYKEISYKTYRYYFEERKANGETRLNWYEHGGNRAFIGDRMHYYMLRWKHANIGKSDWMYGADAAKRSAEIARDMMYSSIDTEIISAKISTGEVSGVELRLRYNKRVPSEYGGSYYYKRFSSGEEDSEGSVEIGRMMSASSVSFSIHGCWTR